MTPKPNVSVERKNQIIDAATLVFTRRGFSDARMDDIVAESGLSKGTLYWYFESKEAIIISILDRVFDWETAHLLNIVSNEETAEQKLEAIVATTIDDLNKVKPLMPILYEFWALSVRNKIINKTIKRYYEQFLDVISPVIQQGIEQGEFRPVPVRDTAMSIGAIFEGTILMWAYFSDDLDFERQLRSNLDLVLYGLSKT